MEISVRFHAVKRETIYNDTKRNDISCFTQIDGIF